VRTALLGSGPASSAKLRHPAAQETQIEQERRAGLIDRLLNEANRQGGKTIEKTPIKETEPAK
jgi:hypothetical protein